MKTPKTVPLSALLIEVIELKSRRIIKAEIEKTISDLEAYLHTLTAPTKPKRNRRAA